MESIIRSDLASEICHEIFSHNPEPDGIECIKLQSGPLEVEKVRVFSEEGERITGKPRGDYYTVSVGKLWLDAEETFREKILAFSRLLASLLPLSEDGACFVAGLGNESITADAIGPAAVKRLLVTRHIRRADPGMFRDLHLSELAAISPGVLGQTGIESADVIESVVKKIRPGYVIAIDALASRDLARLVTTVQLSTTGISPGSGVGNTRPEITQKTLGVPVVSIGVPTVVDAATLAFDVLRDVGGAAIRSEDLRQRFSENGLNFFVTPKETDEIIHTLSNFLAYGINLALNRDLSFEEMFSLIG